MSFEWSVGPPQKKHQPVPKGYFDKINYWGYTQAQYFAPKTAYSASGNPVQELKELVRALHKNGIELILEFYFAENQPQSDHGLHPLLGQRISHRWRTCELCGGSTSGTGVGSGVVKNQDHE